MMENISISRCESDGCTRIGRIGLMPDTISNKVPVFDPAILSLISDVGVNFFRFLRSLGISGEKNMVVLSSKDNYSYDEVDLKNARVLVNLKKLNLIKHLDIFLNALVRSLPPNTSFIGYFAEEKSVKGNGFKPGRLWLLLSSLFDLFNARKAHIMNRSQVTELLEKNGFRTINMKEMSGYTYFISQSVSMPA
jgi:hypothetical protein